MSAQTELPTDQAFAEFPVTRWQGEACRPQRDQVVEEMPVALVYNGISHAVLLATPQQLDDLALGFSLSEGILAAPGELYDLEVQADCQGMLVQMEIASRCFAALKARRRNLAGRTGCGLCGVESLEAISRTLPPLQRGSALPLAAVRRALAALPEHQPLHRSTGAVHGAAWVDAAGKILALREDVGRHNALDKLLGWLVQSGLPRDQGWVLVSSRASYEMVQKVATLGIGCLVAISAPTALAIRLAESAQLCLAGFARGEGLVVYTHPEHLQG